MDLEVRNKKWGKSRFRDLDLSTWVDGSAVY